MAVRAAALMRSFGIVFNEILIKSGLHLLKGLEPGATALDAEMLAEQGAVPALDDARAIAGASSRPTSTRNCSRRWLSPTRQAGARIRDYGAGLSHRHLGRRSADRAGADIIIIDDPLTPEEALWQAQRRAANEWYDHTLYSRLNDKLSGAIVLIIHRLHEDDLAGHVMAQEDWDVVRLPAIAEEDELHRVETVFGSQSFCRKAGAAFHPEREPLEMLDGVFAR